MTNGSITILNASSNILGINSYNNGDDSSKQGFVFISINHGFKFSSIIKSYPNISKEYLYFWNVYYTLIQVNTIIDLIFGKIVLVNLPCVYNPIHYMTFNFPTPVNHNAKNASTQHYLSNE